MESAILAKLGIDPAFIFLFLLVLIIALFVLYVNVSIKYDRLKKQLQLVYERKRWKDSGRELCREVRGDRGTREADTAEPAGCEGHLAEDGERLQESRHCQVRRV